MADNDAASGGREKTTGRNTLEVVHTCPRRRQVRRRRLQGGERPPRVGVSAVNALSRWLEVEVRYEGRRYTQRYERGIPVTPVIDHDRRRHGTHPLPAR